MGVETIPCGGCGEVDEQKRCLGCLHDFGTPTSQWVHRYGPPVTVPEDE